MTNSMNTRCKAKSKQTGEQCRNWAKPGYPVCRFHGAGGRPNIVMPKRPPTAHAPKGNQNARKHGAYSARLLPEEQEVYERIKELFAEELGTDNLTASDQRLIHQLAIISAKFDSAVEKGAPPDALQILNRMVLDLLRELKATRASKDNVGSTGNTPAEVMAALFMKVTGGKQADRAAPVIDVTPTNTKALPPGESEESSESSGEGG
jgi:hypothetical protein